MSSSYVAPADLSEQLRPFCKACGWRKGGVDSWNGYACKCGHTANPMERVAPNDPTNTVGTKP